jgi:hypothetical protein
MTKYDEGLELPTFFGEQKEVYSVDFDPNTQCYGQNPHLSNVKIRRCPNNGSSQNTIA